MLRLVLWDVDNTLIENAGVSKEIYGAAFELLTGRPTTHPARTEGRTDPDIMADLLQKQGAAAFPWPKIEAALEEAGSRHQDTLTKRGRVLPGAVDLIRALGNVPGVVQTIVTGNILANTKMKLAAFGLLVWLDLDVGAYGSDNSDRSSLVALAKTRAAVKYRADFADQASTIVIGDTPRDVEAARGGSARVLAIASGVHTQDDLRLAGAVDVMPDLTDTAAAMEILLQA